MSSGYCETEQKNTKNIVKKRNKGQIVINKNKISKLIKQESTEKKVNQIFNILSNI